MRVAVVEAHAPEGPYRRAFPALIMVGLVFGLIRVVIAALTTHTGLNVLFTMPTVTMPDILGGFTVGGTIESGVILQSLASSFTVVGVMAVFGAVNAIWSHYELIQSAPRTFHELGVVVTVALAFVPATIESISAVREADRARTGGEAVRRGRLLRSALPVLERGMERAVGLSESMDSRGFGAGAITAADTRAGWYSLGAMLALAGTFVALIGREPAVAGISAACGAGLLVAAVWTGSRGVRREHYRRRRLGAADAFLIGASLLAPLALAASCRRRTTRRSVGTRVRWHGLDSIRWSGWPCCRSSRRSSAFPVRTNTIGADPVAPTHPEAVAAVGVSS